MARTNTESSSQRRSRKTDILDAALSLFDERGTASVTTNHIADRAGVSPGNLYYWFGNKQAIIRALFERWQSESLVGLTLPVDGATPQHPEAALRVLVDTLSRQTAVTRRYAVLARELVALTTADAEIAETYRTSYERRTEGLTRLVDGLVASGLLRAVEPPSTTDDLVRAAWILTELGPGFLEATTTPDAAGSTQPAHALLLSHLTPAGRRALGLDVAAGTDVPAHPES